MTIFSHIHDLHCINAYNYIFVFFVCQTISFIITSVIDISYIIAVYDFVSKYNVVFSILQTV